MDVTGDRRFDAALELLEERRYPEAIDAFSELVALSPDMTGAYGNRGLAYLNLGLEEAARKDFETVVQLDPDDAMGYSMLAEITRFRGAPEDTLGYVNTALELDVDEPHALFIRGWLFAKAGQYDMAAEDLARHLELTRDQENPDVEDFYTACDVLAGENPCDDTGDAIDTDEKISVYLGRWGWSFDYNENTHFEEWSLPCRFAHCIRNRPPLAPGTAEGCPVFGFSCPGGCEQVEWCSDNPPFM